MIGLSEERNERKPLTPASSISYAGSRIIWQSNCKGVNETGTLHRSGNKIVVALVALPYSTKTFAKLSTGHNQGGGLLAG